MRIVLITPIRAWLEIDVLMAGIYLAWRQFVWHRRPDRTCLLISQLFDIVPACHAALRSQ
jgi:hypothetical protein